MPAPEQERGDHSEDYTEFNQGDPFVSFGVLREAANPKVRERVCESVCVRESECVCVCVRERETKCAALCI